MLDINLDEKTSLLHIKPNAALKAEDFLQINNILDPYLKQHSFLKGIMIETQKFPGWENIAAFTAHIKFIKNHHAKIQKIALVTDSKFANIAPVFVTLFLKPQIKHFSYNQVALAKQWIEQ